MSQHVATNLGYTEYYEPVWGIRGTAWFPKSGGDTGRNFYVDRKHPNASDSNVGTDPYAPFLTVQAAINASNALIDWGDAHGGLLSYSTIWVAPGLYAENLTPAYFCHIIGTGNLGTDSAAEIHPATGSALAGTGLNLHLANLRFETETAVPVINFGICNNTIIEGCEIIKGIAGLATIGIDFDNVSHLQLLGNHFVSGVANLATGLYFDGGANQFLHASRIIGNHIYAATTGIHIEADCTATNTLIAHNHIIGRPATGINDLSGLTWCNDNWITATADAINHANSATRCIANHVLDAAVGAVEAAGTD